MLNMMKTIISILLLMCTMGASAQDLNEMKGFKGLLNGKIAVEFVVSDEYTDGEWLTAGYCYYPNAKSPAPILVVATEEPNKKLVPDKDNHYLMHLVEYQPNGQITGIFRIWYTECEGDYEFQKGTWTNPTTNRVMQFTFAEPILELPDWYPAVPQMLTAKKREAWTFKHRFDKDKDGYLTDIHVDGYVDGQPSDFHFEESLMGAFDDYQEKNLPWVTYDDINFDGIPDLLISVGITHNASSLYKAFVWNDVTRQFYPVETFDEIQEPDFDSSAKTITSRSRDVDILYVETFKWKNGLLTKVSTKKLPLH